MDTKQNFDEILHKINHDYSKPYILIYGFDNNQFMHSKLYFDCTILNVRNNYNDKDKIKHLNCICIDKYNTYNDSQSYCVKLKKININDILLKLDFYVFDYVHYYINDFDNLPSNDALINDITFLQNEMNEYQKKQYKLTKNYMKELNQELKYLLIQLNYLLIRDKTHKINKKLWVYCIGPYLYV
jgi:hypothetical protein